MIFVEYEGQELPVTNMFDVMGNETDDPDEVVSVVAPLPNGKWLSIECSGYDLIVMTVH
jgi:LDH2 family malate/lactate/ureidoglycolate dehydrogenase